MGNVTCNKCGIGYDYYLEKGFKNYDRPSCRVAYEYEKCINWKGNYYHDWNKRWV